MTTTLIAKATLLAYVAILICVMVAVAANVSAGVIFFAGALAMLVVTSTALGIHKFYTDFIS